MARKTARPGQTKNMAALTSLMTRVCVGEDNRLAHKNTNPDTPGASEVWDENGNPRRSKSKCHHNDGKGDDMTVNAGF